MGNFKDDLVIFKCVECGLPRKYFVWRQSPRRAFCTYCNHSRYFVRTGSKDIEEQEEVIV